MGFTWWQVAKYNVILNKLNHRKACKATVEIFERYLKQQAGLNCVRNVFLQASCEMLYVDLPLDFYI